MKPRRRPAPWHDGTARPTQCPSASSTVALAMPAPLIGPRHRRTDDGGEPAAFLRSRCISGEGRRTDPAQEHPERSLAEIGRGHRHMRPDIGSHVTARRGGALDHGQSRSSVGSDPSILPRIVTKEPDPSGRPITRLATPTTTKEPRQETMSMSATMERTRDGVAGLFVGVVLVRYVRVGDASVRETPVAAAASSPSRGLPSGMSRLATTTAHARVEKRVIRRRARSDVGDGNSSAAKMRWCRRWRELVAEPAWGRRSGRTSRNRRMAEMLARARCC